MPPDLQGRNHTLAPPRNDAPAPLGFYGLEASRPKIQAFSKRWGRSSGPDPALPEWWSLLAPPPASKRSSWDHGGVEADHRPEGVAGGCRCEGGRQAGGLAPARFRTRAVSRKDVSYETFWGKRLAKFDEGSGAAPVHNSGGHHLLVVEIGLVLALQDGKPRP